jgi:hypothetical protein
MPATPARVIHPLCYEHHSEMRPNGETYACAEVGCLLQYSGSRGYFLDSNEVDMNDGIARIHCPSDWSPMYLLEVSPERRSFRLWRCPKCNTTRVSAALP